MFDSLSQERDQLVTRRHGIIGDLQHLHWCQPATRWFPVGMAKYSTPAVDA